MKLGAYLRLMRFDKPIGIWLLWFPTAWALWVSNHQSPPLGIIIYFLIGTLLMRAAGCIVNDIADRSIDKQVFRTQYRPLTTGELTVSNALVLLFVLLLMAFFVVIQLPPTSIYEACVALMITAIYPLCKRLIQAPQLVLGLAFSMGIPMAYTASNVPIDITTLLLFVLNFLWIVSYDTMYAMVDRSDDLKIGVKSTAILFGDYDVFIILWMQLLSHGLWLYVAYLHQYTVIFYLFWILALGVVIKQQYVLRKKTKATSFQAFGISVWYGLLMWVALILG